MCMKQSCAFALYLFVSDCGYLIIMWLSYYQTKMQSQNSTKEKHKLKQLNMFVKTCEIKSENNENFFSKKRQIFHNFHHILG